MATTGSSTSTTSENDEVLLREWNFEKFFPDRSSMSKLETRKLDAPRDNLAYQEKRKIEDMNNQLKLENHVKNTIFSKNNFEAVQNHKLMGESAPKNEPSRLSNFVRSFRRENTDFFPQTKRHSAVFDQQSSPAKNDAAQKMQRSSAIFQRNRPKGEPVLTDFAKRDTMGKKGISERPQEAVKMRQSNASNLDFHRMRREKTESVISFVPRNVNGPPFNISASQQVKAEMMGKTLLQCKRFFGSNLS